jgi:hypothetical protein
MHRGFWGYASALGVVAVLVAGAGTSPAAEQVFSPVVPCRIADTRGAGGPVVPGTVRDFKVTGTGLQAQGGNPLGCGIPIGGATSAVINFVAVQPSGTGNFRAWAYSEPPEAPPNASIINFTTGVNIANGITVPLCDHAATTCTFDIKVQADGNGAQLVADVVGYFHDMAGYTAGTGLSLAGTQFSADTSVLQRRVATVCAPNSAIRGIGADGSVVCEPDDVGLGDITEIVTGANSGLTGGATAGVVNLAVDPTAFNGPVPVVSSHQPTGVTIAPGGTSTLRSVTVTVPPGAANGGHIAVIGMATANCNGGNCAAGTTAFGVVGWTADSVGPPLNTKTWAAPGSLYVTTGAIDQFAVATPGTYTYHFRNTCQTSSTGNCFVAALSAIAWFIPR